jgi:hypothetical protein
VFGFQRFLAPVDYWKTVRKQETDHFSQVAVAKNDQDGQIWLHKYFNLCNVGEQNSSLLLNVRFFIDVGQKDGYLRLPLAK